MTLNARRVVGMACVGLVAGSLAWGTFNAAVGQTKADPGVERARQQVKLLDDIYKTSVVAITEHYVHKEGDLPAASIAKALFGALKKKGHPESRLIDATGEPYVDDNVAKDDFEKAAVKALRGGKDYYEQIVTVDGKQHLRAATPVPVVMQKCTMCHENFKTVKAGVPVGVLTYDITVN
jgi:hypothetical protein